MIPDSRYSSFSGEGRIGNADGPVSGRRINPYFCGKIPNQMTRNLLLLLFSSLSFLGVHCVAEAQPGRDLEFKGEHLDYHFSDTTFLLKEVAGPFVEFSTDSIAPEDRVYVTYDTIQGFMVNGHQTSVYEFPSILRYALTNPARKPYLPQNESTATVMLLMDFPFFDVDFQRDYRSVIGPQYVTSAVLNVMYDIWNEDARYAEDKVFAHLSDSQQKKVVARNPHRIQWLNFSDEYAESLGLGNLMPPLDMDDRQTYDERNIIRILAGEGNYLEFCGDEIRLEDLSDLLLERITNPDQLVTWPEAKNQVVVQLRNQRGTSYDFYLAVYDTIKEVYQQLWETEAQELYGKSFDALTYEEKSIVRTKVPMVISEAEPTPFGDE
jgi:uncharacterized ubiquitin-like protein YukD